MQNKLDNYYEFIISNEDKQELPGGLILLRLAEIKPLLSFNKYENKEGFFGL